MVTKPPAQFNLDLELSVMRALEAAGVCTERMVIFAKGGRVVLAGYANSPNERGNVEVLALHVPGVCSVENHMSVDFFR